MRKRPRLMAALVLMVATVAVPALAQIGDPSWIGNNPDPVVMGDVTNFGYEGPATPKPSSYEWRGRAKSWYEGQLFNCPGPWIPSPSTLSTAPFTLGTPGVFEVEMKCYYPPMMGLPPVTKSKVFNVYRPTSAQPTKGLNTPTMIGSSCEIRFELRTADRIIGPMPNALAQEFIYDRSTPVPGITMPDDTAWSPNEYHSAFHLEGPWIVDIKGGEQPLFYQVGIGQIYYICSQKLRLVYNSACGPQTVTLPDVRLARRRVGTYLWQVELY